ncbi:MAG: tyrosine--tRNA ligase [Rhabdochlamydiaceae bacterium]|nr:tyrosine--tRNA ligase [Candidatus Amphrikana amoebophyrae]
MTPNVIDVLKKRQFIDNITSEELQKACDKPIKFYHGIDPTAPCLHLGNLVGIIASSWFQRCGHTPYILIGGGTGRIGDPSGKSKERPLLDEKQIEANVGCIKKILERLLDFNHPTAAPVIVNNLDWLNSFTLIDFLRDVGKNFRMGPMLAKESVKQRLNSEEGISFTEFTYQVLQGYDFMHLHQNESVDLQIGGSDQWGNITAGCELTRKVMGKPVFGMTYPLLTRSDGKKFGKSEKGAIWLDESFTSVFDFYQYFMKVPDNDVPNLMRMLTFMDVKEIDEIENQLKSNQIEANSAQKRLAEEMTKFIHGEQALLRAQKVTDAASFGSNMKLDLETLEAIAKDFPKAVLKSGEVVDNKYVNVMVKSGLLQSKSEATRLIKNRGAYLNNEKVEDVSTLICQKDLVGGKYLIIGAGKKKKILISVE